MSPGVPLATKWIVVGIDFSEPARGALDYALKVAETEGACLACVHAYEDPPGAIAPEDRTVELRAMLEEVVAQSRAARLRISVELVVRRGLASEKLLNVAADRGADLIVVGATGAHRARSDGHRGTVSGLLTANSTRVVIVVPPSQEPTAETS